jgi:hypothetical protein
LVFELVHFSLLAIVENAGGDRTRSPLQYVVHPCGNIRQTLAVTAEDLDRTPTGKSNIR